MKILLVSQDDSQRVQVGGKHIHQSILINSWRAAGHDVRYCFPQGSLKMSLHQRVLYPLTRRWTHYPARYFSSYLALLRRALVTSLRQTLDTWRPDVISVQDPMAAVACAHILDERNFSRRPPITLTLHGYYTWEMFNYGYYGEQNRAEIETTGFALEREALSKVTRVVTVDSRIRNYLQQKFDYPGPINVVFNAIDLKPFGDAPARSGAAPNCWKLLITRRMVLKNGVIVAIEALAEILRQEHRIRLIMVGDGPERDRVRLRAEELGVSSSIEFVGAVDHVKIHHHYLNADILLMPSIPSDGIEEATSLSMLEGMAAGDLVVCSAIGGMKEIIRHGVNGFLVPPADPIALARQIVELIQMEPIERKAVVEEAKTYVWSNHDGQKHADYVLSLMAGA